MIPGAFDYRVPRSLEEAVRLLDEGSGAMILAGGMSLIPAMKLRLATPAVLIDVGRLSALRGISSASGRLHIGALTTHSALLETPELARLPIFAEAARVIGDPQVRNRGTFGGSLVQAHPAADWPAVLLALRGEVSLVSSRGRRMVESDSFFTSMLTTAVAEDEILIEASFPQGSERTGTAYSSTRQQASGMAIAGVAVQVSLDRSERIEDVSIGVTGVNAVPFRASSLELQLRGRAPRPEELETLCAEIAEADPLSDAHAAADYRRQLLTVNATRALARALGRTLPRQTEIPA